ncbi:MAG: hypothetical protein ABIT04_03170 [Novosphingobium sp.]
MKSLSAGWQIVMVLLAALLCAVLVSLLPVNDYQRWQMLDGTIHHNARWIYERVHYDPTPIDVALIGPSRVGSGVSAPRLSQELAARGLPSNVVNFSLPEQGRNINAVIVEQMLADKRPKLLVIGVSEKPGRFGHSAYKYIAPAGDMVNPGYPLNLNYLPDLFYLPYRQLVLLAAEVMPGTIGMPKRFDAAAYRGSAIETTGDVPLPGGAIKNGTQPASMAELERGVKKLRGGVNRTLLPPALADWEFGDERLNIRRIVGMARARGVPVAFLALPYFTGPATLQEQRLYQGFGPVWNAAFLSPHAELFADYGHLTANGARLLTDWLAPRVAGELEKRR